MKPWAPLMAAVLVGATGCTDGGYANLEAFVEETARKTEQQTERSYRSVAADTYSAPPASSGAPFVYAAGDLRSPFQPPPAPASITAAGQPLIAPDLERAKGHLERFPLAQLHLVGNLSGHRAYAALVRDPDGMIHPVRVGDYMGNDFGRISAVGDAGIELVEIIRDAGGWTERTRFIPLGGEKENDE